MPTAKSVAKVSVFSKMQPWLVVLSAASFFFFLFVQMNIFNALNPYLLKELHFTTSQVGILSAGYFYTVVLFLFPAGIILDYVSVKKTLLITLAIATISAYVFSMVESFSAMMICRLCIGVAGAFGLLNCIKLASRWFPPQRMAFVIGLVITIAMLGGLVAQSPLTILMDMVGWRQALMTSSSLGILFIILSLIFVSDYPKGMKEKLIAESKKEEKIGFWLSLGKAIINPQNWLGGIYTSVINLPFFFLGTAWGSMYLMQAHNLSKTQASLVTSMIFIGLIIGSPLAGWFSDWLRLRKMPMVIGAIMTLAICLGVMYLPNLEFIELMLIFFILGLVISIQVLGYPLVAESNPLALTGTATGLASALIMAGGMLIPVFGWLMQMNWNHTMVDNMPIYSVADYRLAMLVLMIGGSIIGLIAALLARETNCQRLTATVKVSKKTTKIKRKK
jgi:MFS family permease